MVDLYISLHGTNPGNKAKTTNIYLVALKKKIPDCLSNTAKSRNSLGDTGEGWGEAEAPKLDLFALKADKISEIHTFIFWRLCMIIFGSKTLFFNVLKLGNRDIQWVFAGANFNTVPNLRCIEYRKVNFSHRAATVPQHKNLTIKPRVSIELTVKIFPCGTVAALCEN